MQVSPVSARATVAPRAATTGESTEAARRKRAANSATAFAAATEVLPKSSMSVRERFASLEERFIPSKAAGVDVRFQFNLSGKGGGDWYVEIKGGKITVKEGSGPNPTATLKASAEDYLKIANGEMNKTFAYLRGKLKIDGDKDALKKWDTYFREA